MTGDSIYPKELGVVEKEDCGSLVFLPPAQPTEMARCREGSMIHNPQWQYSRGVVVMLSLCSLDVYNRSHLEHCQEW